jgi:hypothetical protein
MQRLTAAQLKSQQTQAEFAASLAKQKARGAMPPEDRMGQIRNEAAIRFAERGMKQQQNGSQTDNAAEKRKRDEIVSNERGKFTAVAAVAAADAAAAAIYNVPASVMPDLKEGEGRHIPGIRIRAHQEANRAIDQTHQDGFEYDCIMIVYGHSNIDVDIEHPIELSTIGDPSSELTQVTMLLSEPGACTWFLPNEVRMLYDVVPGWFGLMRPSSILDQLNKKYKRPEQYKGRHTSQQQFLMSAGYISNSPDKFRERTYDMFNEATSTTSRTPFGSIKLLTKHGVIYEWVQADKWKEFKKSELLGIAKEKAITHGLRKLLFIDLGCSGFADDEARRIWKDLVKTDQSGTLGGKTRRNKRNKRKSNRYKRVRKICL